MNKQTRMQEEEDDLYSRTHRNLKCDECGKRYNANNPGDSLLWCTPCRTKKVQSPGWFINEMPEKVPVCIKKAGVQSILEVSTWVK